MQRKNFREANGECLIWGKPPVFVEASYEIIDKKTGATSTRDSLLLASGFWGIARHFHYVFELTAAYSWCFLANPIKNGPSLTSLLLRPPTPSRSRLLGCNGVAITHRLMIIILSYAFPYWLIHWLRAAFFLPQAACRCFTASS